MGFRLYKSVKLGKVRLNLSKTGVGISAGVRGARYSVHSSGRTTRTIGGARNRCVLPSGFKDSQGDLGPLSSGADACPSRAPESWPPGAKGEKAFVRGVTAYMQGDHAAALTALEEARTLDSGNQHVGEELFAAMSLVGLQRVAEAIPYFEHVLASDHAIPDPIMTKYNIGGSIGVNVTPAVMVTMPFSSIAVALILAEAYQLTDQRQKAIELLESLGSEAPGEPVFALSLGDLYSEGEQWDDVVRVTEGVQTNEDDTTLNILAFRANALNALGMTEGALALTKEALRSKKRNPELLRLARCVRGMTYERAGKAAMAKKEYEKIYAEDVTFGDVAARLGRAGTAPETPPRPD